MGDLIGQDGLEDDQRFWTKVEITGACWFWRAAVGANGYGQFTVQRRVVPAHRWSYQRLVAPIPDGLQLDHLCRVPTCVNPDHLDPVDNQTNSIRAHKARGSDHHCRNGHPRSPENDYVYPNGERSCRECKRIRDRRYYRRALDGAS